MVNNDKIIMANISSCLKWLKSHPHIQHQERMIKTSPVCILRSVCLVYTWKTSDCWSESEHHKWDQRRYMRAPEKSLGFLKSLKRSRNQPWHCIEKRWKTKTTTNMVIQASLSHEEMRRWQKKFPKFLKCHSETYSRYLYSQKDCAHLTVMGGMQRGNICSTFQDKDQIKV